MDHDYAPAAGGLIGRFELGPQVELRHFFVIWCFLMWDHLERRQQRRLILLDQYNAASKGIKSLGSTLLPLCSEVYD
jgi:hypothetical protein